MPQHSKEATVFFTIIMAIILGFIGLAVLNLLIPLAVLLLILAVLILIYTKSGTFFTQVDQYERAVVFRMGRFRYVATPGWLFVIPFIERFVVVDLRVHTVDIAPQEVVTNDNIKVKVDAILYLKVIDAEKAIINVENYEKAAVTFTQASLRDVAGKMALANLIAKIGEVNDILQKRLQAVTVDWGVKVEKAEIQEIKLPEEVMAAMHERKAAEQKKLAQVERAEARKITISAIQEAAGKLTDPTLQYLYLQALHKIAEGKSSKIIFPMELSRLAASMSAKLAGVSYEQAQDRLLEEYRERAAKGEKPATIIETLRKRIGVPPVPPKKRKAEFDFE